MKIIESIATTAATKEEAEAKAMTLWRAHADRTYGVLAFREWHGKPIRTSNPWLVIERKAVDAD